MTSSQGNYYISKNTLTVKAAIAIPTDKVLQGVTIDGHTGTMPDMAIRNPNSVGVGRSQAITYWTGGGASVFLKPQKGYYDGVDTWTYFNDPNLTPANIKKGVSVLGVIGNMSSGYEIGDRVLLTNVGMTPETRTLNDGSNQYYNNASAFWATFADGKGVLYSNFGNGDNGIFNSDSRAGNLIWRSSPRIRFPLAYGNHHYAITISANSSSWPDQWYCNLWKVDKNLNTVRLDLALPENSSHTASFLVAGEDGYLYAGFNSANTVKKINPDTFSVVSTINLPHAPFSPDGYGWIDSYCFNGAYVDSSGNIYIADILSYSHSSLGGQGRTEVRKYNQSGGLIATYSKTTNISFSHLFSNSNEITVAGKSGYLYIVDTQFNLIKINGNTMQPVWSYAINPYPFGGEPLSGTTSDPGRPSINVASDGFISIDYLAGRDSWSKRRYVFILTPDKEVFYSLSVSAPNVFYDGAGALWWVEHSTANSNGYTSKYFKKHQFSTIITG